MKLKQEPDDFQVEELTSVRPQGHGPHAFYRLEKAGWSTPDALAAVRRRWQIDLRRLSCGGLKDRHARTVQYFSIFRGPERQLTHQAVHVRYLGRLAAPYTSQDITGNRFQITLRDIAAQTLPAVEAVLAQVQREGVPNYFDDQRFGSAGAGQFVARLLVLGQFEEALRLALTGPYEHDRTAAKREKALLRDRWGDWPRLSQELPRGHAQDLAHYLAGQPGDFRGAVARLRPELRGLYLSAYQSFLWNRLLALWLTRHCPPQQLVPIRLCLGDYPFHADLAADLFSGLANLQLPLPSARLRLGADDPRAALVDAVLAEDGLELRQLQVRGIRELFFSKGERAALCLPGALTWQVQDDDRHPGQHKLVLRFELPRGAYATLIVKRVQAGSGDKVTR